MTRLTWTTIDDYRALAHLHYRAGRPATIARRADGAQAIVRATHRRSLAGVLVVSMPTLNAAWRSTVWPTLARGLSKREAANAINRHLRCISRVVVDPRFRGTGVATDLVRWYLDRALTPMTEAVAAMGRFSRFFQRAGMIAYPVPPVQRTARLIDAAHAAGLEPIDLMRPTAVDDALRRTPWLGDELRRWALACRSTRSHARREDPRCLAAIAGAAVNAPLTAYAYTRPDGAIQR